MRALNHAMDRMTIRRPLHPRPGKASKLAPIVDQILGQQPPEFSMEHLWMEKGG